MDGVEIKKNFGAEDPALRACEVLVLRSYPSTNQTTRKGFDMAQSIGDDFASGIRTSAITLAFIAVVAIAATVFKNTIVAAISSMTSDIGKRDD